MGITIETRSGGIEGVIDHLHRIEEATVPTEEDLLQLAEILKERNLERTAQGLDADGTPFQPYSTTGPYYFNPAPDAAHHIQEHAAAEFLLRHPHTKGTLSTTRRTIKFESYAAFKEQHSDVVDLRFPYGSDHMLDAWTTWSSGVDEVKAGIQGGSRAATVALEHIRGLATRNLPVRRFIGLGPGDREAVYERRVEQIKERISE